MFVKTVRCPAVALFVNCITAASVSNSPATKFCTIPELFVMPTPLMVRNSSKSANVATLIVNALASALKTMPLTSKGVANWSPTRTAVALETSKVAVSPGPLGTVAGVQLAASPQHADVGNPGQSGPPPGFRFQVALPANAVLAAESQNNCMAAART